MSIQVDAKGVKKLNGKQIKIDERPCKCGGSMDDSWTVSCYVCTRWYHARCLDLPDNMMKLIDRMVCNKCAVTYRVSSQFKPKCRYPECFEPGQEEWGVFCSLVHKNEFWAKAVSYLSTDEQKLMIVKWLLEKYSPEKFAHFASANPDSFMNGGGLLEKSVDELKEFAEMFETAMDNRKITGNCGFDPRLIGHEGDVCQASRKCAAHRGWTEMIPRKLKLSFETEKERRAPDPGLVAERAKTLVLGTTRFSERHVRRAAYLIPYVWNDDDRDYYLRGDPEPFWEREF